MDSFRSPPFFPCWCFLPPPNQNVFTRPPHCRRPPTKTHPFFLFLFLNPTAPSSFVRRFFFSRERERGGGSTFFPLFSLLCLFCCCPAERHNTHAHTHSDQRALRPAFLSVSRRRRPPRRGLFSPTPTFFFSPPDPPPPSLSCASFTPRCPSVSDLHAPTNKSKKSERGGGHASDERERERGERDAHKHTPVAHTPSPPPRAFLPPLVIAGGRGERERERGLFCVYFSNERERNQHCEYRTERER